MSDEKIEKGQAMMQQLFGGEVGPLPFPEKFADYTVGHLFGDLWQGDEITLQQRSLITCTILATLARDRELRLHLSGAKNIGIERKTLEGMLTHLAHYAGWPCAVAGLRALNDVFGDEE